MRRVRAPGYSPGGDADAGFGAGVPSGSSGAASGVRGVPTLAQEAAYHRQLLSSWQEALELLLPDLVGERVTAVLAARPNRVVLLTAGHVAYLRAAKGGGGGDGGGAGGPGQQVTYTVRWVLACSAVDHVRGAEESLRIILEYHRPLRLGSLELKLPLHHSLRAANPDLYQRLIKRISRHIGEGGAGGEGAVDRPAAGGGRADNTDLLITSGGRVLG